MKIQDVLSEIGVKLAYTREETAKLISQSPATLDRVAVRGLINPNRATRRPVYPLDEILRFLGSDQKVGEWFETRGLDRGSAGRPEGAGASARNRGPYRRTGSRSSRTPVKTPVANPTSREGEQC